jgi:hypothetical protein
MITTAAMPSLAKVLNPVFGAAAWTIAGPAAGPLIVCRLVCSAEMEAGGCAGMEAGCSGTDWACLRVSAPHFVQNGPVDSCEPHFTQKFAMTNSPEY